MSRELQEFTEKLRTVSPAAYEELVADLYELVELLEQSPDAEAAIPDIFQFLERCPEADIGSPGPLVHFVEGFYPAYVELLINSIERQPTSRTLWMLNRILNSRLLAEQRKRLMHVLRSAQSHPRASPAVKTVAAQFLAHQEERT